MTLGGVVSSLVFVNLMCWWAACDICVETKDKVPMYIMTSCTIVGWVCFGLGYAL